MHYFIQTLGSKGITSFKPPRNCIRLYGYPKKTVKKLFNTIIQNAKENKVKTDKILSFVDNSVKGIVFPDFDKAIMNTELYEEKGLVNSLEPGYEIAMASLDDARMFFEDALLIHDSWEKLYIENLDFSVINKECDRLIDQIFCSDEAKSGAVTSKRFLGAATVFGAVDYIEDITKDIKTRYYIKGRPGTGKSTFMKKILSSATKRGYNAECYYCAFDPKSIDMIVIRDKGLCFFDSTKPHEHFPKREGDIALDFYEMAAKIDVDKEYEHEIDLISNQYKKKIDMAIKCIEKYKTIADKNDRAFRGHLDKANIVGFSKILENELFN